MPGFPAVEETIMQTVITINAVIMALFFVCYSYQFFYVAVALLKRKKFIGRNENHRIAILIAARNEENVIGYLLDSICAQTYPMDHVDVYVGADNCTDDTARVAREHGAIVFERHDTLHVGKGYVLNDMLRRIRRPGRRHYDAYLVLDADNILDPNFLSEIEKVYSAGYEIVTCYRNSKNYGDNWISAGYALWFLREAQYLNNARMRLGSSCAVSGTGFLFSDGVLQRCGGWNFFLLTEDIEFTIDNVARGEKVGYAGGAVLYDEQPTSFAQSWRQRMRWAKGFYQVNAHCGMPLLRGCLRGPIRFSCYDMLMTVAPCTLLTIAAVFINLFCCATMLSLPSFLARFMLRYVARSLLDMLTWSYGVMFAYGLLTVLAEWRRIPVSPLKKVMYLPFFPLFMFSYIPITLTALLVHVEWKPIRHTPVQNVRA